MTVLFDRKIFFDEVRGPLFDGSMSQDQVDGMSAILTCWELFYPEDDLRWLAYCLATTKHETANTMQPIEEYGRGAGQTYGVPDAETGQTYYGRGFVQLTWRENYARADTELGLYDERSCEWHADNALKPDIAARVMFRGMMEGWFRTHEDGKPETLARYFNDSTDDPYNAREIINGDKSKNGKLVEGYHDDFSDALVEAIVEEPQPEPMPPVGEWDEYIIRVPAGTPIEVMQLMRQRVPIK